MDAPAAGKVIAGKMIKAWQLLNSATYILRRRRFRDFGLASATALPIVRLDPHALCPRSTDPAAHCPAYVASSVAELSTFANSGVAKVVAAFKPTAAVTDLNDYGTFAAYLKAVHTATDGKYVRSANKARRAGYSVHKVNTNTYGASLMDILKSKPVRSWGPVYEALADVPNRSIDTPGPFIEPLCPEHWRVDWVLLPREAANGGPGRAMALATLQRSGDFVIVHRMMGHADVLALGGIKVLQFDIMQQLFDRTVPMTAGIRYVLHGGIEHGATGMADWRRYMQQKPAMLAFARLPNDGLPPDFDATTYLALNPDLRAARMSPRTHFVWHGWLEGRRYRR